MNKEQQELLDDAYENWCKQFEVDSNNFNGEELVNGHNDQCWGYPILDHVKPTSKEYKRGQINAYLEGKAEQPFFYLTQEEFIGRVITNPDFAKQWGITIYTVVEDGNIRIGINYNDKTIESYEN